MKQTKMLRSITERAGLNMEPVSDEPLLELCGDDRILIENHKCVVGYTGDEILIRVSYGLLEICGQCLELSCVNKEQLVIRGSVYKITLIK